MKTYKILTVFFVITFLFAGCSYNFLVPDPEIPVDPDDPNAPQISFSAEIVPIWNDNNNCTACHNAGGRQPDLSTDNAYNSINNTKYVNTANPEASLIYLVPNPDESGHSHKKYTSNQANTVLIWIQQGAKNN